MITKYETDKVGYTAPDSGCWMASRFLGRQSHCFECPFDDCVYGLNVRERNRQIVNFLRMGRSPGAVAGMFNVSLNIVYAVARRHGHRDGNGNKDKETLSLY